LFPVPSIGHPPESAFDVFRREYLNRNNLVVNKATVSEISKNVSELWNKLSESQKQKYQDELFVKTEEYKLLEQSVAKGPKDWLPTAKKLLESRPPKGGYVGFIHENYKDVHEQTESLTPNQRLTQMATMWNSLTEVEQEQYNEKYKKLYGIWKEKVAQLYA